MITRALPQGLARDLRFFEQRVSDLLLHPLVRETPLRAPHHLAVLVRVFSAVPISDESLVAPIEDRVEKRTLYDFLRILRFFELQGEPTSVRNIVARIKHEPIEKSMRRGAEECLKHFSLRCRPEPLTTRLADGSRIDPRMAFDLYMNGKVFHGIQGKRSRLQALTELQIEPILYSNLLHAVIAKANAVIEFYRLLRVHGHVKPVRGDPTYVY